MNHCTATPSLVERVLDCFPAHSYALAGLLRLLDVVETTEVPTAAVECRAQPRLLINPQFVASHAPTAETLMMLVMHELHHVLLGHTTLFDARTPGANFALDAVINGLLCRMFPSPDYTRLFTGSYAATRFPECLLRPPPGWPDAPRQPAGLRKLGARRRRQAWELHRALYSEAGASYQDVFDLLPRLLRGAELVAVMLLGDHAPGGSLGGELERRAPQLVAAVRELVERWPQPPDPIKGRSIADLLRKDRIQPLRRAASREALRRLIRRMAGRAGGLAEGGAPPPLTVDGPLPSAARRSLVLRALGHAPLLHPVALPTPRRRHSAARVHVYVDVSGSMNGVLCSVYRAVADCRALVHPQVHLFSTRIADVRPRALLKGLVRSTGGTDIACVAEHMAANRVGRAVIVTDGFTGKPTGSHEQVLASARVGVALAGTNVNHSDLAAIARVQVALPRES